jgi:predicted nucleic acid-binding protein
VTVALDATALLAVAIEGPARRLVLDALEHDGTWAASALALTEAVAAIDRLTDEAVLRDDVEDAVRLAWDRLHVVPVDPACLDRATQLMREQPVRITHAIHLAAADRLPRPIRFVTFDAAQIPVALGLGFDVVSP